MSSEMTLEVIPDMGNTDSDKFVRGIHSVRQIEHHCSGVRCQMLAIPYFDATVKSQF